MEKRTGLFSNGIIWFGVAISVSEIEAGIEIGAASAPGSLWLPLVLGHLLGGILLFFVGLIGARVRLNAMETTSSTFGKYGSNFFAALNVFQLLAWVAVLNAQGASALAGLNLPISFPFTCVILAVLIAIWVFVGLKRSANVTTVVMAALAILLAVLTVKLFSVGASGALTAGAATSAALLGFWNIFEISIAMPISWLPVISDYTKDVEKPVKATAVSAAAYTFASLWMYIIGVEISGLGAGNNIAQAILLAGLGIPGIVIVVLSTVTTNFLAANSAGESSKAIYGKINPKIAGVIVSLLSAALAISGIMEHYISFLYLIASVFAPMAAVLLVSFYFGKGDADTRGGSLGFWLWNLFSWLAGFIVYQVAERLDSVPLGPTLLAVIVSAAFAYARVLFRGIHSRQ
ncbi:cytosine permease [Fibrobacter sp. UWP2]|uniref:cytosine permease n=1 Tax=Fibrobacter sp. UWP2 TaxID=1896216 RepID=UPI000914DA39|nr:cytosine permease [Fibrobacter sp. UWP2]SHI53773.1 putative hydroxymethylpyrimidine transporter CytX [Fibrobacter sp. UWP2]